MKKKIILVLVIILIFLGIQHIYSHKKLGVIKKPINPKNFSQHLSLNAFKKIDADLASVVVEKDPRAALFLLALEAKKDNSIAYSCHVLAHDIGHAAFAKYHDFGKTMQYQDEVCNSGYMHGVIESYFVNANNMIAAIKTVCSSYRIGNFASWECYHGVGHGIMYFNGNNVPLALLDCGVYTSTFSWSACVNGVFMENFNTDQKIHPSNYLNATNPFYPCDKENDKYKPDCYFYAPIYYLEIHKNAYTPALQWCLTAESQYQNDCTAGVGSQAMKENINDPKLVEQLCGEVTDQQKKVCIAGMVGLYINNFGSLAPAQKLCNQLEADNKAICENVIMQERPLF